MKENEWYLTHAYGFENRKLSDTLKNSILTENLIILAKETGLAEVMNSEERQTKGSLLYDLATLLNEKNFAKREIIISAILKEEILTKVQVAAACEFLNKSSEINQEDFKKAAGIGLKFSTEEILEKIKEELEIAKYTLNLDVVNWSAKAAILANLRESELKFADSKIIVNLVDAELTKLYGPKINQINPNHMKRNVSHKLKNKDLGIGTKNKKEKDLSKTNIKKAAEGCEASEEGLETFQSLDSSIIFHDPKDNIQTTPDLLEKHLSITGGKVITRFPPEPNGFLHIGHAKSMHLNFGYAKQNKGLCYLRFDDTNPEAESPEYLKSIEEDVRWLGHSYHKLTHASDYFSKLYHFAKQLIQQGDAYVCHQTPEEMKAARQIMRQTHQPSSSPWRDRPIEESLQLFKKMKKGALKEGEATLRLKMDLTSPNPVMWDPVAYRIKFHPHPLTGETWKIYPSYDFTHCINDSLENITHSLCTLEFTVRRESYAWLLDKLKLYKPPQWEFSRLNITYMVMSKRKLNKLVTGNYVQGWDDPRLLTLRGLKRRGYPPEAINLFCEKIGITRSLNFQRMELLEECAREILDKKTKRAMVVLNPLRVIIDNYPKEKEYEEIEVISKNKLTSHKIYFSKVLYIEKDDFRMTDDKNYYRLAPGKEVRLCHAYIIKCVSVEFDKEGEPETIHVTYDPHSKSKPKGNIHFVANPAGQLITPQENGPAIIEVREYDRLFLSEYPEGVKEEKKIILENDEKISLEKIILENEETVKEKKSDNYLEDLNPNSLKIYKNALIDRHSLINLKEGDSLQFERHGYFCVDPDSNNEKMIFNRTVTLKEDKKKK